MVAGSQILAHVWPIWWVAQLVSIAIIVYLVIRWRPKFLKGKTIGQTMGDVLDAREEQIRTQLAAAEESRREAARIREEAAQDVARAREEAGQIVERAQHTSAAIQEALSRRAQEEADRVLAQASAEIDYERRQALMALQRRAADIVVDAARQVVRENLDPSADRRIIEGSLSNLKELT